MAKTVRITVRLEPDVKQGAEEVLKKLGIPLAVAVDIYLKQIVLTGGIPFEITLHTGSMGNKKNPGFPPG